MKIIDRYILLIFIKVFCLSMSGIIVLYMVIDMLEKLDDLLPFHPAFVAVMKYFILKIPLIITQTIPVAILISTVISLGMLARNYEIVAMQASGIGLIRIFAPILILTLLITVVVFFLNEMIVPYANEKVKYVRVVEIEGKKPVTLFKKDKVWYKSKDAIYNIRFIDLKKNVLKGFTIFTFNGDFDLVGRIDAKEARWMEGSWLLTSGIERGFARGNIIHAVPFEERTINIPETIDSFKIVEKDSTEMSVSELKTYIRRMEMEGYDTTVLQVDLHSKLSFPVVTLIMTFLGVPFALKTSKFGGIPLCIAVSLLLGFIFWLIIALSVSLGHGGAFPPIVAAWLPNMIFTLLGVYLFITIHY